jgi:hypothetical protein
MFRKSTSTPLALELPSSLKQRAELQQIMRESTDRHWRNLLKRSKTPVIDSITIKASPSKYFLF